MKYVTQNNTRANVTEEPNLPPVVTLVASASGSSILIEGTATDSDGEVASIVATLTKGLTNEIVSTFEMTANASDQFAHSFNGLADGDYQVTVVVIDNKDAKSEKTVEVSVATESGETDGSTDGDVDGETDGTSDDKEEIKSPVSSNSAGSTTPTFLAVLGMLLIILRRKRK